LSGSTARPVALQCFCCFFDVTANTTFSLTDRRPGATVEELSLTIQTNHGKKTGQNQLLERRRDKRGTLCIHITLTTDTHTHTRAHSEEGEEEKEHHHVVSLHLVKSAIFSHKQPPVRRKSAGGGNTNQRQSIPLAALV